MLKDHVLFRNLKLAFESESNEGIHKKQKKTPELNRDFYKLVALF